MFHVTIKEPNESFLTSSPSQITIGGGSPTSQLTVSCRPDAPGITQVLTLEIGKKSSSGSNQPIIRMSNTDSLVQVVDTSLQQRMTASGSISGATGSIQFVLTDLRCDDAASTYYCTTLYLTDTSGSDETTANITARTYPEQIEMFPTPDRTQYDDGQLISFRCTGRIGNQFDENNLQNLWTWEWRSIDNEFSSWTRYTNNQNITYDRPTPSVECQYTGASTLVHTISNLDNGRQFRCSVIAAVYSANKTVYIRDQTPIATPSPPDTCSCEQNQESSIGVGVAVGVCVMVVVDVVFLCVAYHFRDKLADYIVKKTRNSDMPVMSNMQNPAATVTAPVGIPTQGVGDEYEVPENRNDYDVLQREVAYVPNTYEKIRTYQNVYAMSSSDMSANKRSLSLMFKVLWAVTETGMPANVCIDNRSMYSRDPFHLLIFMAFLSGIKGARLITSPSQITIGGSSSTSHLSVSCTPDAPGITQVFNMEIGKKSSSGTKQAIIRMTNTDSSVQVVDTSLQQRMTTSGSISGAMSRIQFILTDLRCADAASTYYCITLYSTDTTGSDEATTNITARTYPEQIEMFPSPDRFLYDDGQLISFRCIGRIGNLFDENNLQNLWAWEWRSTDNEFNPWTRYPDDQSITYDLSTLSTECQYAGTSTLVHTISNLDNGRQFRCSVLSADYSANRTVYVRGQTPIATPSPPNTCSRSYPEQIEMFLSPVRVQYDDGQLISFRCIGRIGNLFDENNLQNLWAWEWRSTDNEFNSWTRYPDDQSITYDLPTLSTECQYTGASTLVHTISNLDNGRQFRCSVLSADYSANRTVCVLGQTPIATPSPPDTCPREQNQESSIGVGVTVGVCVMVVVDVICLCVAYHFRDEIADCIGVKKTRNTNARVMSDMQTPPATVIAPVRIPTQGVGDENEVPENRNDYDVLQREVADVPNTYEKTRAYQNV
ncbi:uncharacterized protein [Haliotis asinina]|uniref:uncharacterized protein n=1 Tax=Haliotis asinina TaxID=109174 RepID=UPI003531BA96